MELTPSPVCRIFSAVSDSEGYHTCYTSDSTAIEPNLPATRSHTAPNPELAHEAEWESLSQRAASTPVLRHTDFAATGAAPIGKVGNGEEDRKLDSVGTGNR